MSARDHVFVNDILSVFPGAIVRTEREGIMIDATKHETASLQEGGNAGGEYLESIGITDVVKLDRNQWLVFVECIVTGFQHSLIALKNAEPNG